jgi:hypothetical protein
LNIFRKYKNIIKCHWDESSSGPVAQCQRSRPAQCARSQPGPAQYWPGQRAWSTAWPSSAGVSARGGTARLRSGGDLTGAREVAGESTAGPHWCVDGGVAELMGIDGGIGGQGKVWTPASGSTVVQRRTTRTTVERDSAAGRRENVAARRTHRRVGRGRQWRRRARTRAAGSGQRWSAARVTRRSVAALSEHDMRDGAVRNQLSRRWRAVLTVPLRCRWGAGAWQPRGDGALTGGPGVRSVG